MVKVLSKNRRLLGNRYEQQAEKYLINQGYQILARNIHLGRKEIDLIAQKDKTIVFVEVKGARSTSFGHPSERVDRRKRKNLTEAAEQFINEQKLDGFDYRFDLITILGSELEHYPDAFPSEEL